MKVAIRKILDGLEKEVDDIYSSCAENNRDRTIPVEEMVANVDRSQLLKNAHIMVCNAFGERSKYDK